MELVNNDIYDPVYLRNLFAEMSDSYGTMNLITSFGFTDIWRRYCVRQIPLDSRSSCCDLMSGMGELIPLLIRRLPQMGHITAIDICPAMCEKIVQKRQSGTALLTVLEEDIFNSSMQNNAFDCVTSSFGLKTFSLEQQRDLAGVIRRILKPGGTFALVELSVPPSLLLRVPLIFYLRYIVPQLGRIFLGNPDNYRMLSVYTEAFGNSRHFYNCLVEEGMEVRFLSNFFGCCTGVMGRKVSPD